MTQPQIERPPAGRQTSASARVTFLGSGTSHGVPMIGCDCAVCRSTDPRDSRLRPSVYIDVADRQRILVDTTPDLRQQALRHGVRRIDAILFTHAHADHILGLDEVRRFNTLQGGSIPCHASAPSWDVIKRSFYYAFDGLPREGGGVPQLVDIEIRGPFMVGNVRVVPVPLWHGTLPILGFRFGAFAYLTDCSRIPDESWALIRGIDTLVLGALRDEPHPTHFTVAQAVEAIARVGPRRAYLTHMNHDLGHAATNARLPAGIELAYDGLVLDVAVDVE
ncbi:MAG TPA: MBL fold metallo-hydrolase [Vicinamibacterales bacterium]|nr:MBL fold metallo-hydrolase [Vicinamibacterales bacterium]